MRSILNGTINVPFSHRMPGTLFIVATPIGNLEDITARALRVLGEVSLIAAEDTRRTAHLLSRYAITTPTTSLHAHNETRKSESLVARLVAGENIALVSDAGTPLISDPGQPLIRQAVAAGVRVESIPGPSAIITALAASGFSTQPFMFLGFPPSRSKDRTEWMSGLKAATCTVAFFEAPHKLRHTLEDVLAQVGDCEILVCRELTKVHEELVRGPISKILAVLKAPLGEFTVVVDARSADLSPSKASTDEEIADELGRITQNGDFSRRQAIARLAKKHGRKPNELYAAVQRVEKLAR